MNPPFANNRAVDHVRHAASLLSPDGRLVAIMPASYRNKTVLDGWQHEWSEIYDNEFKGAGVSVVIVVLTRTKL
jgi:16S rRNA G1207 methylase RsmC